MHAHSLFKWLRDKSSSYECSEYSSYFQFGKIVIRYSNHLSKSSKYNLDIVKTDNFYIVHMSEYGLPKIYAKVADVKSFIDHYLFIYGIITQVNLESNKTRLPEIVEDKCKINSDSSEDALKKDYKFLQLDKKLKSKVLSWLSEHSNKFTALYNEFLIPHSSNPKQARLNAWIKFVKKYEASK